MKRSKFTQITAIIGIVLLVGLYVTSLVLAIIQSDMAVTLLKVSLTGTFAIPVIIYFIMMFYKLSHRNDNTDTRESEPDKEQK